MKDFLQVHCSENTAILPTSDTHIWSNYSLIQYNSPWQRRYYFTFQCQILVIYNKQVVLTICLMSFHLRFKSSILSALESRSDSSLTDMFNHVTLVQEIWLQKCNPTPTTKKNDPAMVRNMVSVFERYHLSFPPFYIARRWESHCRIGPNSESKRSLDLCWRIFVLLG